MGRAERMPAAVLHHAMPLNRHQQVSARSTVAAHAAHRATAPFLPLWSLSYSMFLYLSSFTALLQNCGRICTGGMVSACPFSCAIFLPERTGFANIHLQRSSHALAVPNKAKTLHLHRIRKASARAAARRGDMQPPGRADYPRECAFPKNRHSRLCLTRVVPRQGHGRLIARTV